MSAKMTDGSGKQNRWFSRVRESSQYNDISGIQADKEILDDITEVEQGYYEDEESHREKRAVKR